MPIEDSSKTASHFVSWHCYVAVFPEPRAIPQWQFESRKRYRWGTTAAGNSQRRIEQRGPDTRVPAFREN